MFSQPGASFDLPAYLAHIGFAGTPRADIATLREICRLQPMAIPFENLTVISGQSVSLDIGDLQRKMIGARRGGYCYEMNHVLGHALEAVGFDVTGLAARVRWGMPEGAVSPQSHMALRVRAEGEDFIADSGFGSMTLTAPLRLVTDVEQETPHEIWRLRAQGEDLVAEAKIGADWRPVFQPGPEAKFRPDYEVANWWVATHPQSPFTNFLFVSRPFAGGRRTLFNLGLSTYRNGAAPEQRMVTPDEAETLLEETFGIAIPDREKLRALLARLNDAPGRI